MGGGVGSGCGMDGIGCGCGVGGGGCEAGRIVSRFVILTDISHVIPTVRTNKLILVLQAIYIQVVCHITLTIIIIVVVMAEVLSDFEMQKGHRGRQRQTLLIAL